MICVHQVIKAVRRCCFSSLPVRAAVFSSPGSPALTTFHSEQRLVRADHLKVRSQTERQHSRAARGEKGKPRPCLEVQRRLGCARGHQVTELVRRWYLSSLPVRAGAGSNFFTSRLTRPGDFRIRTAAFKTVLSLVIRQNANTVAQVER